LKSSWPRFLSEGGYLLYLRAGRNGGEKGKTEKKVGVSKGGVLAGSRTFRNLTPNCMGLGEKNKKSL